MGKESAAAPQSGPPAGGRFGTFAGVFTPSILTILGVVMYLRLGWVTGQAGLGGTLLIVVVAHVLSFATGLSVASISTDRTVGAGGAYYMISRALGGPAGAAIGIPLFFAQALSVTFYIVGFTEAVTPLIPEDYREFFDPLFISTAINILLTMISMKSADLAIKTQYVVMAAIAISLVSFFSGTTSEFPREIEWFNSEGESFGTVFAVFFPAVTGIMAGVSMSGDLKDPRTAIPRGTLLAIFVGMVVYTLFPIWLALNYPNAGLIRDMDAVWTISRWPQLIYAGVWGATLSSALGSILTAPRTLQALAWDGLAPKLFGKGSGPNNEPRIGVMLTFVLSQTGIFLGSLDAIAPVLTMFFLATYGVTNLAAGLQKWAGSPSFRPSFAIPSLISLGGGLGCFYVMSIIDLPAMVGALLFCGLIFAVASRRSLGTTYGDSRHGIWAAIVRYALQRLRRAEWHPQNWRPNLVILGGAPQKRPHLIDLGNSIVQDRGIVTYFHLLRGSIGENADLRKELFRTYDKEMAERMPNLFYRVDIVDDVYKGALQVAQTYGMGSFEANSVMAGWPRKSDERGDAYVEMCRDLVHIDRSLLLVKHDDEKGFGQRRTIHVWWGGLQGNGGLMLLLAFLLRAHYRWRHAKVEVLTVVNGEGDVAAAERSLQKTLNAARLDAEAKVLLRNGRSIPEIMAQESGEADLAIVGFRLPPEKQSTKAFFTRMNRMLDVLPTTILVHSARDFESEPVLFEHDHQPSAMPPAVGEGAPAVPPVAIPKAPAVPDVPSEAMARDWATITGGVDDALQRIVEDVRRGEVPDEAPVPGAAPVVAPKDPTTPPAGTSSSALPGGNEEPSAPAQSDETPIPGPKPSGAFDTVDLVPSALPAPTDPPEQN